RLAACAWTANDPLIKPAIAAPARMDLDFIGLYWLWFRLIRVRKDPRTNRGRSNKIVRGERCDLESKRMTCAGDESESCRDYSGERVNSAIIADNPSPARGRMRENSRLPIARANRDVSLPGDGDV